MARGGDTSNTCPTAWQGFPDGNRKIQVRLRTHFSVATVTVHVRFHSLLYDTTKADEPRPVLRTAP